MHRARKRHVTAAVTAVLLSAPTSAWAFHAASTFDKPPGAGGGGGIFYAGAPLEHGWTCQMCHENAAGKIIVELNVDPPELFQTFEYVPGQAYTFTAAMKGEHLGLNAPLSNYNSIVVEIADDKDGFPIGSISGFAPEQFYSPLPSTIASSGQKPGETSWKFTWTATSPDGNPVHGPLTIYLAGVDGNAANSPGVTLTDPFDDDVFTGTVKLKEAPGMMGQRQPTGPGVFAYALGIVVLGMARRRRTAKGVPSFE